MISFTKDQVIIQAGKGFTGFSIITEGSVLAAYDSFGAVKPITLKKGDIIGIFDFGLKEHTFTYTALEDTTVITYSLSDFSGLEQVLQENKELHHFLVLSMIQNISKLIHYYNSLCNQQTKLYQYLETAVSNYQKLCQLLNLAVKTLPNQDHLQPFSPHQPEPAFWLENYYQALKQPVMERNPVFSSSAFVIGLLARGCEEIHNIIFCCQDLQEYLQDICRILLNDNALDLFDLYTDLLFRSKAAKKDTSVLEDRISKMIAILNTQAFIDRALAQSRIQEYQQELIRDHSYEMPADESLSQIEQKLAHSLELILDYADSVAVTRNEFKKYIDLYKNLQDKNSMDKNTDMVRRQLTRLFNMVYTEVFQTALNDPTPPIVIKMFLHFGYVDLELAGLNNAAYLYSIAKSYQGDPENGIYTLYEWISAIYDGRKQPSRNELSQDYSTYVHTLRSHGKIDPSTVSKMLDDNVGKVVYELENMFPVGNKISNGHYTTFCPIFIEENVIKDLDGVLVTPYKIKDALQKILAVDFSAFYRTTLYSDDKYHLRETIQVDVKPDFILMPNIGYSGICWQEIEGMQRTTPGRFVLSVFHMENLEQTLLHMIGDFRWEMCRRIQGLRWNDVTDHSLTSDYYDYAMFYSKNRALSQDAKEKIKLAMNKAKHSIKNLFITDYCNWVTYESKGSVKLNKVSRQIFAAYCPFPASTCEELMGIATFSEPLDSYLLKKKQQLHRLNQMGQKYQAQGKEAPSFIEEQIKLIDI